MTGPSKEAIEQAFEAWYADYPDTTEYMDGMRDAFMAGARRARLEEAKWWLNETVLGRICRDAQADRIAQLEKEQP